MTAYDKTKILDVFGTIVRFMLFLGYTPEGIKTIIDKIAEEEE